jgi:tRNA threonylcarbamoyladenosine biosynthesis protein TsaE
LNYTLQNINDAASHVVAKSNNRKLWIFRGEMGAGKTTLIKSICQQLQVKDEISSPTFSLVNEYHTANGKKVFHFDFYRIKSIEEVYDMGYEDYFYSNQICLIEWPEKIEEILVGEDLYEISIQILDDDHRALHLS